MGEDAVETEIRLQFAREQRMQIVEHNPLRQQVRVAAPQLARAGDGEQEAESAWVCVNDRLDAVQQRGDTLYLVDEDGPSRGWRRLQLRLEALGLSRVLAKRGKAREVEDKVRFERPEQRRLPTLPRAQQEDRMTIRLQPGCNRTFIHVGKIAHFLPTSKNRDLAVHPRLLAPRECLEGIGHQLQACPRALRSSGSPL
jgi:hypothetical protein